jgi:hypothetical protein
MGWERPAARQVTICGVLEWWGPPARQVKLSERTPYQLSPTKMLIGIVVLRSCRRHPAAVRRRLGAKLDSAISASPKVRKLELGWSLLRALNGFEPPIKPTEVASFQVARGDAAPDQVSAKTLAKLDPNTFSTVRSE